MNETKSTPKIQYVNEFIDVLKTIYDYFPEHKGKELIPIFSALNIPEDVKKYLTKNKWYLKILKEKRIDIDTLALSSEDKIE
ncbi:MAG: hypothetical protein HQK71_07270 [Desulfamplus sp.]|nr:hypothetical protein [Desulfamplus sp.]